MSPILLTPHPEMPAGSAVAAGQPAVVRATHTGEIGRGSEQLQMLDTFTVGD